MLGPDYSYTQNINAPAALGVSSDGTIATIGNDIKGLTGYVDLLITGQSAASKTGGPLGNKYFLNTSTQCVDIANNNNPVDRYIYVNNVPGGEIPFLSAEMGDVTSLEGLVPGILSNMANISIPDPVAVYQAFQQYNGLPCQEVTMETIDGNNNVSSDTQFVSTLDMATMDPCWFPDNVNPVTNESCKDAFRSKINDKPNFRIPNDPFVQMFFAMMGCLFVYFIYRFVIKTGIQ